MRASLIICILFSGCSLVPQNAASPAEPTSAAIAQAIEEPISDPKSTYDIEMKNFAYSVTQITADAGDVITINLKNKEGTHNFVIDELGIQSGLPPIDETETITIKIPENASGKTYEYYCSIGTHRELGMTGKIIIE